MKFLIFGDVVGRPGREAVSRALPELRQEWQPDSVIINIENIAHGAGISPSTVAEAREWQADVYTTGDHAWDNIKGIALLERKDLPIIRPANYPAATPGRGYHVYVIGAYQVAIIQLQGQVFFRNSPENPFATLDNILSSAVMQSAHIVLVEMHAEATSEKRALGWYADGRVSAVWGTHTHVPTADAQILPSGTGYITDVGMNGNHHSVIGVDTQTALRRFLTKIPASFSFDSRGPQEVNALFLDIDPVSKKTTRIAQIRKIFNDSSNHS